MPMVVSKTHNIMSTRLKSNIPSGIRKKSAPVPALLSIKNWLNFAVGTGRSGVKVCERKQRAAKLIPAGAMAAAALYFILGIVYYMDYIWRRPLRTRRGIRSTRRSISPCVCVRFWEFLQQPPSPLRSLANIQRVTRGGGGSAVMWRRLPHSESTVRAVVNSSSSRAKGAIKINTPTSVTCQRWTRALAAAYHHRDFKCKI